MVTISNSEDFFFWGGGVAFWLIDLNLTWLETACKECRHHLRPESMDLKTGMQNWCHMTTGQLLLEAYRFCGISDTLYIFLKKGDYLEKTTLAWHETTKLDVRQFLLYFCEINLAERALKTAFLSGKDGPNHNYVRMFCLSWGKLTPPPCVHSFVAALSRRPLIFQSHCIIERTQETR